MIEKRVLMKFMATLPNDTWDRLLDGYDRCVHLSFEDYVREQHPEWWFKYKAWKAVNYGTE